MIQLKTPICLSADLALRQDQQSLFLSSALIPSPWARDVLRRDQTLLRTVRRATAKISCERCLFGGPIHRKWPRPIPSVLAFCLKDPSDLFTIRQFRYRRASSTILGQRTRLQGGQITRLGRAGRREATKDRRSLTAARASRLQWPILGAREEAPLAAVCHGSNSEKVPLYRAAILTPQLQGCASPSTATGAQGSKSCIHPRMLIVLTQICGSSLPPALEPLLVACLRRFRQRRLRAETERRRPGRGRCI